MRSQEAEPSLDYSDYTSKVPSAAAAGVVIVVLTLDAHRRTNGMLPPPLPPAQSSGVVSSWPLVKTPFGLVFCIPSRFVL